MNTSWHMFRPEWYASGNEIKARGSRLVAVAVDYDAASNANLIAAAPSMLNALIQVVEHLESAGELASIPFRIQWDMRAAIDNAKQPLYTASQPITSGEPSC